MIGIWATDTASFINLVKHNCTTDFILISCSTSHIKYCISLLWLKKCCVRAQSHYTRQMTPGCRKITLYTSTRVRRVGDNSFCLFTRGTSLILWVTASFPTFKKIQLLMFYSWNALRCCVTYDLTSLSTKNVCVGILIAVWTKLKFDRWFTCVCVCVSHWYTLPLRWNHCLAPVHREWVEHYPWGLNSLMKVQRERDVSRLNEGCCYEQVFEKHRTRSVCGVHVVSRADLWRISFCRTLVFDTQCHPS